MSGVSTMAGNGQGAVRGAPAAARRFLGLKLLAAAFIALKLVYLASAGVFMDDAYYWLWGQHLALSYYDHPAMIGWTQGLSALLFGWNRFALRAMLLVSTAGDIAVLYLFARRLAPEDWQARFWPTLVIFLSTPLFIAITGFAVPDHWLVFFTLLASYGFTSFLVSRDAGAPRHRWLYLGALALGLGILSKYNAAFLGLGAVLYALLTPRFRGLFRDPHLYLAGLLVVFVQAPVIAWNLGENLASYEFIAEGRHAGLTGNFAFSGLIGFLGSQLAVLGPAMLAVIGLFVLRGRRDAAGGLARTVFWLSTVAILAVSIVTDVLFHWNLVAYAALLPFLVEAFRPAWLRVLHVVYGFGFCLVLIVNYAVVPVMAVISYVDQTSSWTFGWQETADYVRQAAREHQAGFIASTSYEPSAELAFALQDPDVTSLAPRREQFDYWFDRPAHAGDTAILVAVSWRPLTPAIKDQFASVDLLDKLQIVVQGRRVDWREIYLAKGFKPGSTNGKARPTRPEE